MLSKRWAELGRAAVLPFVYLMLVFAEQSGAIDHLRGLDQVSLVAENFSLSYASNACKPIHPDNAAWKPLLGLIEKYSKVKLRPDKTPLTIARVAATFSAQQPLEKGEISEWTAPSTPFMVIYRDWSAKRGETISAEDVTVVGSIGDLQTWIAQSKGEFHVLIHDIVLGVLTLGNLCTSSAFAS